MISGPSLVGHARATQGYRAPQSHLMKTNGLQHFNLREPVLLSAYLNLLQLGSSSEADFGYLRTQSATVTRNRVGGLHIGEHASFPLSFRYPFPLLHFRNSSQVLISQLGGSRDECVWLQGLQPTLVEAKKKKKIASFSCEKLQPEAGPATSRQPDRDADQWTPIVSEGLPYF